MEAVGRLAGGIAHDFNNLLTAIIGSADVALSSLPKGHAVRSDLQLVLTASDRAARLTAQLLAFARPRSSHLSSVDLFELVSQMNGVLKRMVGDGYELAIRSERLSTPVRVDRSQLEQVVLNLVVNARDAMPTGGTIELSIELETLTSDTALELQCKAGPYVRLSVRDHGIGIDAATRSRIFDPFFTTKEDGSGLGLSTCYGIISQAGGAIRVESRPGSGTQFHVYVPLAPVASEVEASRPDSPAHGAEIVLVVEDEEIVRSSLARMLRALGYNVLQAHDGASALILAKEHRGAIDLVVSDITMPGMTGPEFVATLREAQGEQRVLFITGNSKPDPHEGSPIGNGDAFLQKPFTTATFGNAVREALA
jgi:CheY-like chemotaxis protein